MIIQDLLGKRPENGKLGNDLLGKRTENGKFQFFKFSNFLGIWLQTRYFVLLATMECFGNSATIIFQE